MKTKLTLLIFLFMHGQCMATNPIIDSLLHSLETNIHDTSKVNAMNELAWQYRTSDSKQGKRFAEKAKALSQKIPFRRGYVTSLARLGSIAVYQKKFKTAETIYLKALQEEKRDNHIHGIGRAQNQLATIYKNKEQYDTALRYALSALKNFQKLEDKKTVAIVANNIGTIYKYLGKYDKALKYMNKSLAIHKNEGDVRQMANCYLNIGAFHTTLKNYTEALSFLKKSEGLFIDLDNQFDLAKVYENTGIVHNEQLKLDLALEYFQKAKDIKKKLGILESDPYSFNNIGSVYYKKRLYDKALGYYLKSCEIQDQSSESASLLDSYKNVAIIYQKREEYDKAIIYYKTALNLSQKSKKKVLELQILKDLSSCYTASQQYELATKYSNQYIELSGQLETNYRVAMDLNTRFAKQKQKLILANKDKKLIKSNSDRIEAKSRLQRITIIGLVLGIVLISLLFFAITKIRKQKQKTILAETNTLIEQQKISDLLKKQELKSLSAMLEGQEEERKRIAKDLHDRLGSMLSMVKIHFNSVEDGIEKLKDISSNQYEKANSLLDEACDEVRKIAHNMNSGVLDKFGLTAALEDLKETLNQTGKINVEFLSFGIDERLDSELEITIYRIVQELVSNVLKYSKAKGLTIQLLKKDVNLNVTVEDDGAGFDSNADHENGMGLNNVASRVDKLDGKLLIDSTIGNGTTISIDIPV